MQFLAGAWIWNGLFKKLCVRLIALLLRDIIVIKTLQKHEMNNLDVGAKLDFSGLLPKWKTVLISYALTF